MHGKELALALIAAYIAGVLTLTAVAWYAMSREEREEGTK